MASRNRVILRTLLSQLLGWLRKGKDGREVMAGKWQPYQELLPLVTQCFFLIFQVIIIIIISILRNTVQSVVAQDLKEK